MSANQACTCTCQEGEEEQADRDPGAAVALGAALLVRLLVPAWVVNATSLPISAVVAPRARPPRPSTVQAECWIDPCSKASQRQQHPELRRSVCVAFRAMLGRCSQQQQPR